MDLLRFHKGLIATAILLCAGFAVRDVATGDGGALMVLRVAASVTAAIALTLYLRRVLAMPINGAPLPRTRARDN